MTNCYKCGTELRSTSKTVGLCGECMYKAIPYEPQPEKHCTHPLGFKTQGAVYEGQCDADCSKCDYAQPTPTMPLREQIFQQIHSVRHGKKDGSIPNTKDVTDYIVKLIEAHDSEVAKQAVKEFAEKVIMVMPLDIIYPEVTCPDCDKPTEWQEGYKTGANSMKAAIIKGIRAMAEE